jgi:CHC2 zinc finger/Toprim-like
VVAQEHAAALSLARYDLPVYRPLRERGIAPETLAAFAVSSGRWHGEEGWLYPVYGPGRVLLGVRFKSAERAARYKYGWVECKEGAASVLYGAGCIRAGAPAVLCAGEPDAWLLHSLDIAAATSLRGEGASLPAEAVAELLARAPSLVLVAYDRDEAGRAGAARTARALRDAGLRARALALPADLPEGGDLCDLYRARSSERTAFMAALATCRDLDVPPPAERRAQGVERRAGPWDDFNASHDLLSMVHDVVRLRKRGQAHVGLCPFHHESQPSFHVYSDHYYCYGCQRWGSAWDFDRWLKGMSAYDGSC